MDRTTAIAHILHALRAQRIDDLEAAALIQCVHHVLDGRTGGSGDAARARLRSFGIDPDRLAA